MPRLFTALEIPRDAALSLSLLRGGLPGARWIDVENYHLTLRFIGDVEGHIADDIANALDRVNRKFSPHVTLARLRNSSPADVAQYLSARGNFSTLPFRVGRFVLMSSRDSVGGGPYIVEEAWPLVGADPLASSRFASASDASRIMR
ncbi:MAG: RNA 2',3'-cyclic phosphodiesterase [Mesorhizobium sp.]|nr:MAG: RNA 2',3'-cyclic phosphodiesterase [Mesorhizobium sp.]